MFLSTNYISLLYICSDVLDLVMLGFLGYASTIMSDSRSVHKVALLISFLYMSKIHLMRMIYDQGGYILDITGPAMIGVQKITSLAFSLHDGGARKEEDLTMEQKKYAVRRRPSLLEYFSYLFAFQTLMCGPLIYYNDYVDFITEENFKKEDEKAATRRPSPTNVVLGKLSMSLAFAVLLLGVQPFFPSEHLGDATFLESNSFWYIVFYMVVATTAARFKYYLAWQLGETVCNASGLGFGGFREDGTANWELAQNISAFKVETSQNFRTLLENWNITTQSWLRRCGYERSTKLRTLKTYVMSAVWHGFWPGFYVTFLTGFAVTTAARNARRHLRPLFLENRFAKLGYDVACFLLTRVFLAYTTAPFVLLTLDASFRLYARLYFFGHLLCLPAVFLLPRIFKAARSSSSRNGYSKEAATTSITEIKSNEHVKNE